MASVAEIERNLEGKTLEQMCIESGDPATYHETHELVKAFLFSRYEKRRKWAKDELRRYWEVPVGVASVEKDGMILSFIKMKGRYIFVGQYAKDSQPLEVVPSEESRKKWDE